MWALNWEDDDNWTVPSKADYFADQPMKFWIIYYDNDAMEVGHPSRNWNTLKF